MSSDFFVVENLSVNGLRLFDGGMLDKGAFLTRAGKYYKEVIFLVKFGTMLLPQNNLNLIQQLPKQYILKGI